MSAASEATVCTFFLSPSGCKKGKKCRFRHISALDLAAERTAADTAASERAAAAAAAPRLCINVQNMAGSIVALDLVATARVSDLVHSVLALPEHGTLRL